MVKITGKASTRQVFIDDKELLPEESQKVYNHSPDGYNWGYEGSGQLKRSQISYKISGDSNNFSGRWDFINKKNARSYNRDMNNKESHIKSISQKNLFWNIRFEFNGRIYQYFFTLISSHKIYKELIIAFSKIENITEPISGKMFFQGDLFGDSSNSFSFIHLESFHVCSSPYIALKLKPSFFTIQMLNVTPLIVTNLRTKLIFPRSSSSRFKSIRKFFKGPLTTQKTLNFFTHFVLLSFCGYLNIITPPKQEENDGPAQLALALMLKLTETNEEAMKLYQEFKRNWIAFLPQDKDWELDTELIEFWILKRLTGD